MPLIKTCFCVGCAPYKYMFVCRMCPLYIFVSVHNLPTTYSIHFTCFCAGCARYGSLSGSVPGSSLQMSLIRLRGHRKALFQIHHDIPTARPLYLPKLISIFLEKTGSRMNATEKVIAWGGGGGHWEFFFLYSCNIDDLQCCQLLAQLFGQFGRKIWPPGEKVRPLSNFKLC